MNYISSLLPFFRFNLCHPRHSPARNFGIIMMNINNLVAFGLFCGPLFHVLENFLHVHEKPFYIRVLVSRLPVVALIILFAVGTFLNFWSCVTVIIRMNCVDDYVYLYTQYTSLLTFPLTLYFFGHPSVVSFFCHQTHIDFL